MSIKINNVFFTYSKKTANETRALADISTCINDGDFVAILGETGSGKSTLIQMFNGLLMPEKGMIEVDQFIVTPKKRKNKHTKDLRKKVGVVFQFPEYQLFEDTVEKDVAFGPRNFGIKENEALTIAHNALNSVGIDESFYQRSPFDLSGGEKRRIAIAGILALNPDIIVLDEPTAGLDPHGTEVIMTLLQKINEEGKTVILVTHDMNIVMRYARSTLVLHQSNLLFSGSTSELFKHPEYLISLEVPPLYRLVAILNEKGLNIDVSKIKNTDDLAVQLKEKHDV
mgnify:CR=1 FL=1